MKKFSSLKFVTENTFCCSASLASFDKYPMLYKLQNTLYTLNRCWLCLGTNLFSMYNNGKGEGKRLQGFLSVALSNKVGVL